VMRRGIALVLAAALALVLGLLQSPAGARAASSFTTGFADYERFASTDPAERSTWLDRAVSAGAGIIRLDSHWSTVASAGRPADPTNPASSAYDFSTLDAAVRDAEARGLGVMLNFSLAPPWAEGADRPGSADVGTWKPNPADYADFLRAATQRYSGGFDPDGSGPAAPLPAVQAIQVWNEPNHHYFLNPQWVAGQDFAAAHYRDMLNAAYAAIKAVNPGMRVVTAGLSPYGDPTGTGNRVRPVQFWRDALCVKQVKAKKGKRRKGKKRSRGKTTFVRTAGCPQGVHFDVFAHHPINTSGPPTQHAFNADDASSADLGRIASVLRGAERAHTVSSGKHPLWATEMWWDSRPPSSPGSPLARQARWIEQALYLAWRDGASAVINLLLEDATSATQSVLNGNGSGIYFADGQPKPSATAFRFPLVADRLSRTRLRVWGKAPAAGRLAIQRRARGRWVVARKIRVKAGGVFAVGLRLRGKQRLRARVGGLTSLTWKQR
jgi:hypothetical protein